MKLAPVKATSFIPAGWADLVEEGPLTAGLDLGTTRKGTSNPSALCLMERDFRHKKIVRLALAWKTNDPRVTRAILWAVLRDLKARRKRLRRLGIDATSERFFAADLARELAAECVVDQIIASEKTVYRGEEMLWKAYLGNLLVNAYEVGDILHPDAKWIRTHIRQVRREKGSFEADVDEQGNHADFFDAEKMALHEQGKITAATAAEAAAVGSLAHPQPAPRWRNPLLRLFERARRSLNP